MSALNRERRTIRVAGSDPVPAVDGWSCAARRAADTPPGGHGPLLAWLLRAWIPDSRSRLLFASVCRRIRAKKISISQRLDRNQKLLGLQYYAI